MVKKNKAKREISNRLLYTLITIGVLAILGFGVYAFGGSSPGTVGHSAGELDLSGGVNGNALFNGNVTALGFVSANIVNGNFVSGDGSRLTNLRVILSGAGTCNSTDDGLLRYRSSFCSSNGIRSSAFDVCMRQGNSSYNWYTQQMYNWSDSSCSTNGCPSGQTYYQCSGSSVSAGCYTTQPRCCWPNGIQTPPCPF